MTNGVSCRSPTSFLKGPDTGCVPPQGKSTGRGETFFFRLSKRDSLQQREQLVRPRHTGAPENGSLQCTKSHNGFLLLSSRKIVGIMISAIIAAFGRYYSFVSSRANQVKAPSSYALISCGRAWLKRVKKFNF